MIKNREWLNNDGTLKSDNELKILCKNWNAEKWECYLREFSYVEREVLQSTDYIDRTALESFVSFISDSDKKQKHPLLKNLLIIASQKLSSKEQETIRLFYRENLSLTEISKQWRQNEASVRSYKNRGLNKIKKTLLQSLEINDELRSWFKSNIQLKS